MSKTLRDVAREAKVSVSTVSRVINNEKYTSKGSKKKVLNAIEKINYRPNLIARGLKKSKTRTVGIILPEIENPFMVSIINMIENLLYEKGYSSILSITDNNPKKEKEQLNILKDKLIDGFIVIPGSNTQYEKMFSDEKVIAIDTKMNIANETCIKSNNYLGIKLAMDLLLEQGHRKIGIVNIPMFSQNGIERLDAFKAICLKEKIILKDTYIKYTEIKDYSELGKEMIENSYAQTIVLMSQEDRPTAVISTGIYVSIGMLRAFTKLNTSIPEDISFISFDELYKYSDLFKTSITTIKQPVKEISVNAVELLLKKIENEEVLPGIIEIEPQLVMGDSCMSVKV